MTPAVKLAKKQKIDFYIHEYEHDPRAESYGLEAAKALDIDENRVFKTLVVIDEKQQLAVAVLPVNCTLNLKKMAKVINVKKVSMANPTLVERSTGYVLGGVSPLGQKKRLLTVIHLSAQDLSSIFVSAGKRGLEIELPPQQLSKVLNASFADIINTSELTNSQ